jgi:hypothetical protein
MVSRIFEVKGFGHKAGTMPILPGERIDLGYSRTIGSGKDFRRSEKPFAF